MWFLRTLVQLSSSRGQDPTPPRWPGQCQLQIWKQSWMEWLLNCSKLHLQYYSHLSYMTKVILIAISIYPNYQHHLHHAIIRHYEHHRAVLIAEAPQPATTLMIILSPLLLCKLPLPELIVLPDILNQLRTVCIFWVGWKWMRWQWISLTIPSLEHVVDEEVIEANLGFWDWAGRPVKLRHHNWQALTKDIIRWYTRTFFNGIIVNIGQHLALTGPDKLRITFYYS